MRELRTRANGVAALVLLTSCAPADGPAPTLPTLETWTAIPELRFGSLDHPDYSFGPVGDIALHADGTIYTAHPQQAEIRRWGPEAEPLGAFGGRGEGPGEFMQLGAIGLWGDTLWAMSARPFRLTLFSLDGSLMETRPLTVATGAVPGEPFSVRPRPTHALRDGSFYGVQTALLPQIAGADSTLIRYVRVDSEAAVLGTLFTRIVRPEDALAVESPAGGWLMAGQPFPEFPLRSFDPATEALVVVDRNTWSGEGPATFGVARHSMAGDRVYERRIPYEPVPIADSTVETMVERVADIWERSAQGETPPDRATLVRLARTNLHRPTHYPPVSSVVLGTDGTVWLRDPLPDGADAIWTVLGEAGEPLARIKVPFNVQILLASRDAIWGVDRDAEGVSYVSRFGVGR